MHPYRDVAIVGVHNTVQARALPDHDSRSIALEGALGALADAGIEPGEVDGVVGQYCHETILELGIGPCPRRPSLLGIPALLDAVGLVTSGESHAVLLPAGGAGLYRQRSATAPWTRPSNELVAGYGLFTAAEFALMARRHMEDFGTTANDFARVAAVIRNNGHVNPDAVYSGRGPFSPEDILASRMVAEPFHLLDCATTSEGGCAIVVTSAERASDHPAPVWILGAGEDCAGPAYALAPVWDSKNAEGESWGWIGARAAKHAFATAGLSPSDVDVAELYDPFSFEIIRQLEAFGFCRRGEGAGFVADGGIEPGGALPVTTDGGTMSFSHPGINAQQLQRVIRAVEQLRGTCKTSQVEGAEVALCSNGGSAALYNEVLLLGSHRP